MGAVAKTKTNKAKLATAQSALTKYRKREKSASSQVSQAAMIYGGSIAAGVARAYTPDGVLGLPTEAAAGIAIFAGSLALNKPAGIYLSAGLLGPSVAAWTADLLG